MPRTGRNKSKTKIYHLILRGINKQTIFEDDEDRIKLIQTLQECKNRSENGANATERFTEFHKTIQTENCLEMDESKRIHYEDAETKGTVPAVCLSQNIDFFHA